PPTGCRRTLPVRPGRSATHPGPKRTYGSPSSRRAKPSPASNEPLLLLPRLDDELEFAPVALRLGDRGALAEDRPRRTGQEALAAGGAGLRAAPGLVQVGDHFRVAAPAGHVPGVYALDLVAH